jgi:hypothetical protein
MIAPTGREIPDPPDDAEQRRLWKREYYRDLYGWSSEELERARRYENPSRYYRHRQTPSRWILIMKFISAVAILIFMFQRCR